MSSYIIGCVNLRYLEKIKIYHPLFINLFTLAKIRYLNIKIRGENTLDSRIFL